MTTESTPPPAESGPDFTRARALWARAEEQRDNESAPYLDTIEALSYHVPDLLAEVNRLRSKLAELPDLDTIRRIEKERGSWGMQLAEARRERDSLAAKLAAGEASDGYHTHNELYDFRLLYNAHAARGWLAEGYHVVKSWRHADGEKCFGGGWFVVHADLPTGAVTNHYEAQHWGLFDIPQMTPPEWDGHTPADAAERLRAALNMKAA